MATYIIYTFILFGTTISAYISQSAKTPTLRGVFLFFTFFIPFIFLAIRYEISYDYHNYVYYFYQIVDGNIPNKGWLYVLINLIIAYLELDVQWLFVVFAFFTLYFTYKAIPNEIIVISMFLYITLFYLYDGMDIIRQGLALSIMAYATKYIEEKRFFRYLLWAIVAMGIHLFSGLILLLLYPVINIRFNRFFLILFVIIMYLLVIKFGLIEKILSLVASEFPQYAWYVNNDTFTKIHKVGTGLGILFKMVILFIVIWYKDKIVANFPKANIFINMYVLYTILIFFYVKMVVFCRVKNIFIFGLLLSIGYFIKVVDNKSKIVIAMLIMGFYAKDYYSYIQSNTRDNIHSNLAVVNPYQTILDRGSKIRVDTQRVDW